jgi:predicted small secreted protein
MVTVRLRALSALIVAVAAVLLAACGNATDQTGSDPTRQPTTAAPSSPPSSAGPSNGGTFKPGPTGIPVGSPRAVTIDGVIEAGVEPGCKVLTAGNTRYLILGGGDVPLGVPVRVEGTLQPGVLSTCQQGTPLRVTTVKRR